MQSKNPRPKIIIGKKYGSVTVISKNKEKTYLRYNCLCDCGRKTIKSGQNLLHIQNIACEECTKKRAHDKFDYTDIVGNRYGKITVTGIDKNDSLNVICKCDCGTQFVKRGAIIKRGQIKMCKNCTLTNLKLGDQIISLASVGGTNVISLQKNTINKNNTSGVNGVSLMKSGKYRANITFKRKQYHLGSYYTLEDAEMARKIAEKEIYGNFLRWYEETYPERNKKIRNDNKRNKINDKPKSK